MDDAQFIRLLELAGPIVGARLIDQLIDDLQMVEHALLQASVQPDWPSLRAQSHILIALAGTVGAKRLQYLAERMHTLAQTGASSSGFRPLHRDLMVSLDRLIQFLGLRAGFHQEVS